MKTASLFSEHRTPRMQPVEWYFDGRTYDPKTDLARLKGQLLRVWFVMRPGQWTTLKSLAQTVGGSEASVSARLRDLRKPRFGGHTVERKHVKNGLYMYRLVL